MTPREKAIEAAAKAIYEDQQSVQDCEFEVLPEAIRAEWRETAENSIDAYLAALEAEVVATRGEHFSGGIHT